MANLPNGIHILFGVCIYSFPHIYIKTDKGRIICRERKTAVWCPRSFFYFFKKVLDINWKTCIIIIVVGAWTIIYVWRNLSELVGLGTVRTLRMPTERGLLQDNK